MVLGRDDVWAGYERMVVEIDCCEQPIVVRPDPSGRAGEWPWPGVHPVHILTAWDPGKSRPGLAMNRRCQARLEAELRPQAVNLWSARGGDPATGVRRPITTYHRTAADYHAAATAAGLVAVAERTLIVPPELADRLPRAGPYVGLALGWVGCWDRPAD